MGRLAVFLGNSASVILTVNHCCFAPVKEVGRVKEMQAQVQDTSVNLIEKYIYKELLTKFDFQALILILPSQKTRLEKKVWQCKPPLSGGNKDRHKDTGSPVKKKTKSLLFCLEERADLEGGVGEILER